MTRATRSAVKKAIQKKVPQLDRAAMRRERERFEQAEREKAVIRGRLERLREKRVGA